MTGSGFFNVTERSRVELEFDFQSQSLDQVQYFKAAHLWLFPQISKDAKDAKSILEINFLIAVTTPSMKGEKRKRLSVLWNRTSESCLSIDVTIPLHKLVKQLQLRNEWNGKFSVEVTHIKKRTHVGEEGRAPDILEVCKELSGEASSTMMPFLVIDYTAEEIASGRRPRTPAPQDSRVINRELSAVDLQQMYREARGISENKEGKPDVEGDCKAEDLWVNMTLILNLNDVIPQMINIKECRGRCSHSNSTHSSLKTRHLENEQENEEKNKEKRICCIPRSFVSVPVLLSIASNDTMPSSVLGNSEIDNKKYEVEILRDAIVESCMCYK